MIHFIAGKPRGGKTLYSVGKILDQLENTQRFIVTNVVLRLDRVQDYLDEKGCNVHVLDRVRILTDEETPWFFLYREGLELPRPAVLNTGRAGKTAYDETPIAYAPLFEAVHLRENGRFQAPSGETENLKGTAYFIDEVHNHFGSRGWQGTPDHLLFYLSQHGKLNDICFFITQAIKNCDPVLYRVAQDFTYCRNKRIEKYGVFKGQNKFTAKTYFAPATTGNEVAAETKDYALNLAIAHCYDTSAGVGMPGGGRADGAARAKGVPLVMLWVGIAACAVLAGLVFGKVIPGLMGSSSKLGATAKQQVQPAARPAAPVAVPQPVPTAVTADELSARVAAELAARVQEHNQASAVWTRVSGVSILAGQAVVTLVAEDGRSKAITSKDPRLEAIYDDGSVLFAGRRIYATESGGL